MARRNATKNDSANSPITPPTIERLQQIAQQQNATLVEYSIIYDYFKIKGKQEPHESELYIWVISPTGVVTFRKADLNPLWQKQNTTLADLVFTRRDSLGVRDTPIIGIAPRPGFQQRQEASRTEQLQQLHKLLIEPIALAPDSSYKEEIGKVNGLLTAEEILDLKLNAELVVLSACNTGRGKITGDGVIGLSRSLISAGVPSVLVSLWSVPDAPTAQLMTEFYQNWQKNPDKAQALRQAMLAIMKQHPKILLIDLGV